MQYQSQCILDRKNSLHTKNMYTCKGTKGIILTNSGKQIKYHNFYLSGIQNMSFTEMEHNQEFSTLYIIPTTFIAFDSQRSILFIQEEKAPSPP